MSTQHFAHPLHLLDDLLASLSSDGTTTSAIPTVVDRSSALVGDGEDGDCDCDGDGDDPPPRNADEAMHHAGAVALARATSRQDAVLRAADALFGGGATGGALLENSLALLDEQARYRRDRGRSTNDDRDLDDGSTPTSSGPVMRRLRAKSSGREAILVRRRRRGRRGVGAAERTGNERCGASEEGAADEYYLCLLGRREDRTIGRGGRRLEASPFRLPRPTRRRGAHCTCMAFFQNIKGGVGDDFATCKHLLAAMLMPYMLPWSGPCGGGGGVEIEIVDDRTFAKLVARASIG